MITIDDAADGAVCAGCGGCASRTVSFLATDDQIDLCDDCEAVLVDMLNDR